MKVLVGERVYASKKAAERACQTILYSPHIDVDGQSLLHDLLELHPSRDEKVGCGIAEFYIGLNDYKSDCFWFKRLDGSRNNFSFRKCITHPTIKAEVQSAFRNEIHPQVVQFKERSFAGVLTVPCAITGVPVFKNRYTHIDHRPPDTFHALVKEFLQGEGLAFDTVKTAKDQKPGSRSLADTALADRWCTFHAKRAVLQITCQGANLSQGDGK